MNALLSNATAAVLVNAYNTAIDDYGVDAKPVKTFRNKAAAIDAIAALCATGNLAVIPGADSVGFEIVDAAEAQADNADEGGDEGEQAAVDAIAEGWTAIDGGDEGTSNEGGDEAPSDEGESDEGESDEGGDEVAGFVKRDADWLAANPRGTDAREAYRKERRKSARAARKAKEAALDAAIAGNE